jgi:hypothetical protein
MSLAPCLDCGTPSEGPRCPSHRQPGDGLTRSERVRVYGYHRPHWRHVRQQRLTLDGHRCTLQLPGCTGRATHVHLAPELHGNHDTATIHDCQSACASCSGAIDAPRALGPTRQP